MKLHCPDRLKSLQVYSVYPIHTATGQLVSNPNRTTLDRERRRYFPSTSRFQKNVMIPFSVSNIWIAEINSLDISQRYNLFRFQQSRGHLHFSKERFFIDFSSEKKSCRAVLQFLSKHPNNVPFAPCPKPPRITLNRKIKNRRAHERPAVSMCERFRFFGFGD